MDAELLRDRALERLRRHYIERTPLFWQLYRIANDESPGQPVSATEAAPACRLDNGAITMQQLQRLMRSVVAEYQEVL